MQTSEQRDLPSQARRGKRAAPPYASRCVMRHASQRRALPLQAGRDKRAARSTRAERGKRAAPYASKCVMRQASEQPCCTGRVC
eukprot:scaffold7326_cov73-Phaeocystis_antarctica.AAC.1